MTVAEIIHELTIDTEDFLMANMIEDGFGSTRIENVFVTAIVDLTQLSYKWIIQVANNIDIPAYETSDFDDAVAAAFEAHEYSIQFVQF